ncbi:NAD(P)-dependent oxidoreductase [Micromonospora sp. NPDC007271]|uniref:NAD(P)-dependent oxidoreductase n=1 Tax=Micromonospora sp. NPDC007271 TaxID=3154587 RepID=UPI003403E9A2
MTRPRVLVTADFDPAVAQELSTHVDLVLATPSMAGLPLTEGEHAGKLDGVQAVVCELDRVDAPALAAMPDLSLVVSCRAAPVNVDLGACAARGVTVATTPARNADVTADLTMGLLLATIRQTSRAEQWMRSGAWTEDDVFAPYALFRGPALAGRTIGIIGGGAIGRRVAARATGFGMRAIVHDPYLAPDALAGLAELVPLDQLMSTADVVSVHVALSPATTGLIGEKEIRLLKPSAYLINAGRAAIVDERALMAALREKRIAGAGFDVFWSEPLPADHELLSLPNVTLTPHIAGASDDVITAHSRMAAEAILDWLAGRRPVHAVDTRQGAHA